MQADLSEYEIELLRAGYRNEEASTFTCPIPSMVTKLKGLGLIEDFDKIPEHFIEAKITTRSPYMQLTVAGALAIGAKCQVCKEGEPIRVGPTGSLAKITIYCQACSDRWDASRQLFEQRWRAEREAEAERRRQTFWYKMRRFFRGCHA